MQQYRRYSRRDFLKAAALSAACGAPLVLRATARGAATAANSRFNLGFIGMGKQNSYLLTEFLHRPQAQW